MHRAQRGVQLLVRISGSGFGAQAWGLRVQRLGQSLESGNLETLRKISEHCFVPGTHHPAYVVA